MPDYRLYRLTKERGSAPQKEIWADTDAEAIAKAALLMNGDPVDTELWESARLVAKLPSTKPAQNSSLTIGLFPSILTDFANGAYPIATRNLCSN
jgi:hypothetical protein